MVGCIYKVSCINNNKFLYGSTTSISDRRNCYNSKLSNNQWSNRLLQNCYNKYGKDSIKIEIVQDNIPEEILEHIEDIWIGANKGRVEDKRGGMNVRDAYRVRFNDEIKKKMSIGQLKRGKRSQESIDKQRKTWKERYEKGLIHPVLPNNKGRIVKREFVEATRLKLIGRKDTPETIAKKKAFMKGKKLCKLAQENSVKATSVKVNQYDKQDNFIREWESMSKFYKLNNLSPKASGITACCKGKLKTYKGYKWKYA